MFKSARWRGEKNKVKVVFKLQFQAAKVSQVGEDALMISVVPADAGKPTVKSDKATVRDGSCLWENPVYETVKFNREPKSGKIHERIYYFVVGTGSSKAGVIGEASIDLSNYAETTKVSLVSLPLKSSKTEAVLHVSIQRMQESIDQRDAVVEQNENAEFNYKDNSLRSQLSNSDDNDGTIKSNSDDVLFNKEVSHIATELNGNRRRASSGSDATMSSSESSSGVEIAWQPKIKNDASVHREPAQPVSSQGPNSDLQTVVYEERQRSQWGWLGNSAVEASSTDDSPSTPRETFLGQQLEEGPDIVIEKLKSELASLSRQAEMSEIELRTLRQQIVKESKRGQDFFKELTCLKEERDALRGECEKLKAKSKTNLQFGGGDSRAIVEELRQELDHAKQLNADLRVQLQKTQEANSELILAVGDLEEMLEQKNKETDNHSNRLSAKNVDENDDEEQKALEELVKEHGNAKETYLLEQQIMDMRSEIEIYKRDRDELEMQMEQLALDYEIMKQENHEMAYKLEQSELQEQLKMQYECSSSYATVQELEKQIENLENELKRSLQESEDAFATIRVLEANVLSLEEDLEKQSEGFEADLEALMRSKIEQEQRAIKAEEMLKKTKRQNANTAERLQEEFRRLSVQMASTFEANEKVAAKALAEARDLRTQKGRLEEIILKASEEHQSVNGDYEARLNQLSSQVISMTNQIERMQSEIEDRTLQLEDNKKVAEETQRVVSDEILKLKNEIEAHIAKNKTLSEEIKSKETLMHELEQMRMSVKEMELLMGQDNHAKTELKNRIVSVKSESEESQIELNKMRRLLEEKEAIVMNLQCELDSLQSQYREFKNSVSEDELEKEKLTKQVDLLKSDLKKKEDACSIMEMNIEEVAGLKERIKFLEVQIKSKEDALETSSNAVHEKEHKIEELEQRLDVLNQSSITYFGSIEEARNTDEDSTNAALSLNRKENDLLDSDELQTEMALLKERNKLMEAELKEMQERYSEISLKFAEVEGERQQLVMRIRSLKNAKKKLTIHNVS